MFLCIFSDNRGHHRKSVAILVPLKSIYNQNLGFIEQKMYFEQCREVQLIKKCINFHCFSHENIFWVTFSELPPIGYYLYYAKMRCSIVFIVKKKIFFTGFV
jgi:hypothetical protein